MLFSMAKAQQFVEEIAHIRNHREPFRRNWKRKGSHLCRLGCTVLSSKVQPGARLEVNIYRVIRSLQRPRMFVSPLGPGKRTPFDELRSRLSGPVESAEQR